LPNRVLLAFGYSTLALSPILPRPSAFASRPVALGCLDTIAALSGAPFARLAVASEADRPENLSTRVADLDDVHAMLREQFARLRFSDLHSETHFPVARRLCICGICITSCNGCAWD
jgi:hypothetical protein